MSNYTKTELANKYGFSLYRVNKIIKDGNLKPAASKSTTIYMPALKLRKIIKVDSYDIQDFKEAFKVEYRQCRITHNAINKGNNVTVYLYDHKKGYNVTQTLFVWGKPRNIPKAVKEWLQRYNA